MEIKRKRLLITATLAPFGLAHRNHRRNGGWIRSRFLNAEGLEQSRQTVEGVIFNTKRTKGHKASLKPSL